jgi:hypothetical protein
MASDTISVERYDEVVAAKDARILEAANEVAKWRNSAYDKERVLNVALAMLKTFIIAAEESYQTDKIREAVKDALTDTALSGEDVAIIVEEYDICSPNYVSSDYSVTIVVPVEVTIGVSACDADSAEQAALEEAERNSLYNYHMDVNWDYAQVDNVEEA